MPDPDRGPLQGIVKYNPHLWGDDELRSIFVVRNRELAALLDRLRQTPAGAVPQHALVVGQRGMGKTTLLRRLALGVRDDAELSRQWIALSFPEEQFTVSTLAELWSNVLDALTDALETEGAPLAELDRLDGEIRRIGFGHEMQRKRGGGGVGEARRHGAPGVCGVWGLRRRGLRRGCEAGARARLGTASTSRAIATHPAAPDHSLRITIAACTRGIRSTNVAATRVKLTHVHSAGGPMRASDASITRMPMMAWPRDGARHTRALVVTPRPAQPIASTLFQFHGAGLW
jgi:hypothetical protein